MCTPFSWASLGSALSRGPWGTDAQNSTVAMPWLRSRSKKVAEMVMESHWVPRKKRSQEHREEEMEGRAGRCWRVDGWTGQSQDGTPGYRRGGVLPTDVTTEGAAPGGAQREPEPEARVAMLAVQLGMLVSGTPLARAHFPPVRAYLGRWVTGSRKPLGQAEAITRGGVREWTPPGSGN